MQLDNIAEIKEWVLEYYRFKKAYSILRSREKLNMQLFAKLAELTVSYNLFSEDRVNWDFSLEGDGGIDLIYEENTIDVKCTKYYRYPELKENSPSPTNPADIYCLVSVVPEDLDFTIVGYIPKEKFLIQENFFESYRGLDPKYVVTKKQLYTLRDSLKSNG